MIDAAPKTGIARSWWVRLDTGAAERLSGRPAEQRGPRAPRQSAEIRNQAEIEFMAEAGRVAALALRAAAAACVPGATTAAVDGAAGGVIAAERCEPAFLGLRATPRGARLPGGDLRERERAGRARHSRRATTARG